MYYQINGQGEYYIQGNCIISVDGLTHDPSTLYINPKLIEATNNCIIKLINICKETEIDITLCQDCCSPNYMSEVDCEFTCQCNVGNKVENFSNSIGSTFNWYYSYGRLTLPFNPNEFPNMTVSEVYNDINEGMALTKEMLECIFPTTTINFVEIGPNDNTPSGSIRSDFITVNSSPGGDYAITSVSSSGPISLYTGQSGWQTDVNACLLNSNKSLKAIIFHELMHKIGLKHGSCKSDNSVLGYPDAICNDGILNLQYPRYCICKLYNNELDNVVNKQQNVHSEMCKSK